MTDPKLTEAMGIAEAVCAERCAQAGDPPCSRVSSDPHCDECMGIAFRMREVIATALAEKDAVIEGLVGAMVALRDDMVMRAEMHRHEHGNELVVACGNGVWIRFNKALAQVKGASHAG